MNIAVYPGSFDPCTNGHLDIIKRGSVLFDKLYVSVLNNSAKTHIFSVEERIEMIKSVTEGIINVEVITFDGLLAHYMDKIGANVIIKGLRALSDFEYEFQMALTNNMLNSEIQTIFLPTCKEYMFLSSSIVREIATYKGNLKGLVPDTLIKIVTDKFLNIC